MNQKPYTTALSMADLIDQIRVAPDLPEKRRSNLASSIRRFCAALAVRLDTAPAAFWYFREQLEKFHPAQAGITPRRWATIRSDVSFALRRAGLAPDQPKPRVPLSPVWAALQARAIEGKMAWKLSRLARFCDSRDIPPSMISDAVITDYHAFVRAQTFRTKPERHVREVCLCWNRLAALAADLQLRAVTPISNRQTYSASWEALPASFRSEAETWLMSLSEECDLLSETGRNRPLRPASITSYRYTLRQAVAGLEASGRSRETIDSLADLVAPNAARQALRFHLDRNGGQKSQMLGQIANVLMLVARDAVGAGEEAIAILRRFRSNLMPARSGMKPRPREALRQFGEQENIEKLLMLPERIYRRLKPRRDLTLADARLMQVAVALEILLMRPIRRGNLISLRLEEHIIRSRGRTMIVIDGPEVKNGIDHEYPIPPETVRLLDFYIERLLPLFGDNPESFLFPGALPGKPRAAEGFGRAFTATIQKETGLKVYPHLLRHFGAMLYLNENPDGMETVRRVLGHRSSDTTHRSYGGMQDEAAVRRYDATILGIRNAILKAIRDA